MADGNSKFTETKCDRIMGFQPKSDHLESNIKNIAQQRPVSNEHPATRPVHESIIQFKLRESYLTELLKTTPLSTVRNLIWSIVLIFYVHILLVHLNDIEKTHKTFGLMYYACHGIGKTLATIWLPMLLATLLIVYAVFTLWVYANNFTRSRLVNFVFLAAYICYVGAFIILPFTDYWRLSIVSRIVITHEQIRMLMKTHAFVRENASKVLDAKAKDEHEDVDEKTKDTKQSRRVYVPKLANYVYFMFAPTTIYRDDYPRTSQVRWTTLGAFVFDFISTIVLMYFITDRITVPYFESINIKQLNLLNGLNIIIVGCLPAGLYFILTFYGLYQCWQNIWAELLRFGDRQFYTDWWNATSSVQFLREWNILVQNWIYSYLYRDFNKIFRKNKFLTVLFTFGIVGIAHDYIISLSVGYIVPLSSLIYTFTVLTFIMPNFNLAIFNIIIWTSIFITFSVVLCYSCIEWYARYGPQCPRQINTFYDYLVPRFYYCID